MNETKRLLTVLISLLAFNAAAETSVSHIGVIETDYSQERQPGVQETDTTAFLATLFLTEVNHGSLPHSQAAFLERASSLTMAWADLDADFGNAGTTRGDAALIQAEYIMPSHWLVGATYSRFQLSRLSEQENQTLEFGRYVDDTSTIIGSYEFTKDRVALMPDATTRTWGVEYKNVIRHPTATSSLTLDFKYQHINAQVGTSNMIGARGEYHFTLATSVTAEVDLTSGKAKGELYTLGLTQYLTRFFAVGSELSQSRPAKQKHINTVKVYARLLF